MMRRTTGCSAPSRCRMTGSPDNRTVVGIMGRQETLDVAWDGDAARKLKEFANGLSCQLGFAGNGLHRTHKNEAG